MEQDLLPIVVVLVAIFAAMLALAALVVPADATAPAACVDGSAGQGTDTAPTAGPGVDDDDPGVRVGAWDRPPERQSRGPTSPTGFRT
jgi:hypothetical protein